MRRILNLGFGECTMGGLYDVIIIGGGASGLAAAVSASSNGLSAIVVEKERTIGGTTLYAIGSITAGVTELQKQKGIYDSTEEFLADLELSVRERNLTGKNDHAFLKLYSEESGKTVDWLSKLGVVFYGPSMETPHRVPRMHNAIPNSYSYIYALEKKARKLGTDFLTSFVTEGLITENGYGVKGIKGIANDGNHIEILSRLGVVIATGPFSSNAELKRKLVPRSERIRGLNPAATGDGIFFGIELGASVLNADIETAQMRFKGHTAKSSTRFLTRWPFPRIMLWGTNVFPKALIKTIVKLASTHTSPSDVVFRKGAILVDENGKLVYSQYSSKGSVVEVASESGGGNFFAVFNEHVAENLRKWPDFISTFPGIAYAYLQDYKKYRKDIFHNSDSLETLALWLGMNQDNLRESVLVLERIDVEGHGKVINGDEKTGFYALGPMSPVITVTQGGLEIGHDLQVKKADGTPIDGLYAIGDSSAGPLYVSHGMHLGWAFTSGRLVGETLARRN